MHSAIVVVKVTENRSDWSEFVAALNNKIENDQNVSRLGENVWLVNFQESPAGLAWLIGFCDARRMTYGILPLADAPQWLPAGFDPSTIQGRNVRP